jgi:membrane fusion protein (multidrug efflux system)
MDTPVKPSSAPEAQANASFEAPSRKPDRSRILLIGGAVILIGGAVWGVRWWTFGRFMQSTDDAYLQADSMTVAPKVTGYVAEVLVTDNQTVTAGQPLVRLDNRQYAAMQEQADAAIAARKADIERAEAELLQQQASIVQARANVLGARAAETHTIAEVQRYEPLVSTGAESGEKLADLRNSKEQASAKLAADIAALQAAERQPATTRAQIDQARAQLQSAQASSRQSQLDVGDTTVRSTLTGRVGDRSVRVGQFVQPGTRMMTIVPVQDVYLTANFKETQIGRMRAGQPATIKVDALSGEELHGTIESFSPGTGAQFALLPPQNATGNFTKIVQRVPVRIHIDTDEQTRKLLLPGLSVTVEVDTRNDSGKDSRTAQAAPRE